MSNVKNTDVTTLEESPTDTSSQNVKITVQEALHFHQKGGRPGKVSVLPTKELLTQRDLSLAYSPGVAEPCKVIHKNPEASYDYTARGNYVAVISNGTAVLGLGNLGALASKPVMEGKAVLFKRFADIDSVDIEVDTEDPDAFINAVRYLGPTWGGINLEDIKAPECFIIEDKLKELMDVPIFHDDQHGTAIICVAGLINAAYLAGKEFKDLKVVVNGAGAAGIACLQLIKELGVQQDNALLCDTRGVIYKGRTDGMNQWKLAHAANTKDRTLADAMKGADVFLGLSVKGAVSQDMVKSMAAKPIIFAMANPDPEITPEDVKAVRDDAIVATGRSDYPNQVNNVMGFPYIFRGALDVHATTINEEMKLAAANALAKLAREPVPEEVLSAYQGRSMEFGPSYIIPVPFDPRLISTIPVAVAEAAMKTKVAKKPLKDIAEYKRTLAERLNPTANLMNLIFDRIKANPKRIVFAEGEESQIIRTAASWRDNGYGTPILVGKKDRVEAEMQRLGVDPAGIEIQNAAITKRNDAYIDYLYGKLQRKGYLHRDVVRMVKNDRIVFASCMAACGDGDAIITGLSRGYFPSFDDVMQVIDPKEGRTAFGISIVVSGDRTVFIADTTVHEKPSPEELADVAVQAADKVHHLGFTPRVALLSFSNFGTPGRETSTRIKEAVRILDKMEVDFEYDGEISADVALNEELLKFYPFNRLSGPANVLIMPSLHAGNIAYKLMKELGGGSVIGPILSGLETPAQVVPLGTTVSDILNIAALAAIQSIEKE